MICKDRFINAMTEIERYNNSLAELSKAISKFTAEPVDFYNYKLTQVILNIFADIFQDDSEWITYFAYDCDFLKDDKKNSITESDGTPIVIDDWGDVYDMLIENMI